MPQEVDILSDQPLKEVDIGWNYSKNYVAMRTRKISLVMQKANIVFYIIITMYWNDGARDDDDKKNYHLC